MARVVQTDFAREDTRAILRYLRTHSRAAATRFADALQQRYKYLATSPNYGRARPEFGDCIRSTVVGDYVVVYHAADDVVTVVRVLHGARDVDTVWRLTDWEPPDPA